jgi:SAM-dependent methyltransferase
MSLLPPPELREYVGGGDFEAIGNGFLDHFKKYGDLKPDEAVLDVGCGTGRMALPLTKYLTSNASYQGFDIEKKCIAWCNENISPKYNNFKFQQVDVINNLFNPDGKVKPDEFLFPYKSDSFDFVFLTSVFTHLLPGDLEHYLSEISRVLKKDGRCFITYFLVNPESKNLIEQKKGEVPLFDSGEGYFVTSKERPEAVVGYNEEDILRLYPRYGLSVRLPLYYGFWCGRERGLTFQDVIIAVKK